MSTDPYRLPRTVVPARYELRLEPDLDAARFDGDCTTEVEVAETLDEIVVNAAELDITEAWVEQRGGAGRRVAAEVRLDPDRERAHLLFAERVEAGTWFVVTRFRGVLNDQLRGFYRSTFTDDDGDTHIIATTQMEATHARRAFPCWDEPELKAVFGVTLVVDEASFAVSNGAELARTRTEAGKVAVQFADTMVMSTYLVAFVVGPLEATPAVDVDNVDLRVVARPGQQHLTDFALDVGAFALRWFEDYYGIVYPGGKLDLVAVPDFAFGAMENTGCVTFREILLLVDPDRVSQPELQRVVDVISHEIAHMWFGNLVTMRWWNGIWLNEAFATFMETSCTAAYRPEWQRWVTFSLDRSAAFDVDALGTTRPIEYEVVSPEDAEGMFDVLTYEKGGAVLRMLEQYLGAERFRDGVRRYLHTHQFDNTETTDLWDAIEAATGEPVRRLMDTWIFQGGFPLVHVEPTDTGVRLRQERFTYLPEAGDDSRWAVPVLLRHGSSTDPSPQSNQRVLLDGETLDVTVPTDAWVQVNAGASGFFRVHYAPELLERVLGRMDHLDAAERYALVDDRWAAVLAGATTATDFLGFAEAWGEESDLAVWQRLLSSLGALDRLVDGSAADALAARVGALLGPARRRLTADDTEAEPARGQDERLVQLRATLLENDAVLARGEHAVAEAEAVWDRHQHSPDTVDPARLAAAINVLAARGRPEVFDTFWTHYRSASTPQAELRYLGALADLPDPDDVDRLLAATLTDDIRTQDAPYVLRRALANRTNGPHVWAFVRDRWDQIGERFPSNSIARMLEGVRHLSQPDTSEQVLAFFATHEVPQGAQTLAQHLERLRVNVALREREADRFAQALRAP